MNKLLSIFKRKPKIKPKQTLYHFLNHLGETVHISSSLPEAIRLMQEVVSSEELINNHPQNQEIVYGYNFERNSYYTVIIKEGE